MHPAHAKSHRVAVALRGPAIALATVAIATGIKLAVGRFMVEDAEVMFLAAVAIAAWAGGLRGGAAAVLLSTISQAFFFIEPRFTIRFAHPADGLQLGAWVLESSLLCAVMHARDLANARAIAHAEQAEAAASALAKANAELVRESQARGAAEKALRVSNETNRLLFEASPCAMFVVDEQSERFVDVNRAALALYRYDRPQFLELALGAIATPSSRSSSVGLEVDVHRTSAGQSLRVEVSARTVNFGGRRARLVAAKDVTERERLEQQLRHAQKMKAVGQLAGGVAHDFNNLLFIILGYASSLLDERPESDPDYECLAEIKRAAQRSAELTKQLLVFSRREPQAIVPLDVSLAATEMRKMLERMVTERITVATDLAPGLPRTKMDPGKFEQVMMNLVVNARDAMPKGGRVEIRTGAATLDEAYAAKNPGSRPGRYVVLSVGDNGVGMDKKTVARIFEPFYTTKGLGHGSGLGLSIVFGIVEDCGGHIKVQSEPGRGTTLQVFFPVHDEVSLAEDGPNGDAPLAGIETVLVVEDEGPVREMVRRVLEKRGYRVMTATKPSDALAMAERTLGNVDLLLTDVIMPEMNGRELADELRRLRPDLNVLYMSGFTDAVVLEDDSHEGRPAFLQKPMTPQALIAGVRRALDAAAEADAAE